MNKQTPIIISYFSDILCIWAYVSQIRLDELKLNFGDQQIKLQYRFLSLFGSIRQKIGEGWKEKGGFEGYSRHVKSVAKMFEHIQVHPNIWQKNIPLTSASCHLFLKAIQLLEEKGEISKERISRNSQRTVFEEVLWQMRVAFFKDLIDISQQNTQLEIVTKLGLPTDKIIGLLENGEAFAALCTDLHARDELRIMGSPTFVLNEGRQILYGNVGYRVLEANVKEILIHPENRASWC